MPCFPCSEKHGTKTGRSWRTLHIGLDADTGQIVAAALTRKEVDDASQVAPLLDQAATSVASFTADGAYDQDSVSAAVATRHPAPTIIVPPRSTAVRSGTSETAPPLPFHPLRGRNLGQLRPCSGITTCSSSPSTDERRATEVNVAVNALIRMLDRGRPISVRIH